jgi:glycosyltransferase involved in cell wall biosynthesis
MMRIAATGFVSLEAGSVASANALIIRGLLELGHAIDFFSKPSFVDPRPAIGDHPNFRLHDCTNLGPDSFRRKVRSVPVLGFLAERFDAATYNKLLVRRVAEVAAQSGRCYDLVLWLGDYAHGVVAGAPTVSFAQGPPGTDARSVVSRRREIRKLAGLCKALQLELLARLRLTPLGLPKFAFSNHFIVGSKQSKHALVSGYRIDEHRVSIVPYPVDLDLFRPSERPRGQDGESLRVLWLGRIVPRKRLDLFLNGAALAIRQGAKIELTVVGGVGFAPGYERLLSQFPFQNRLNYQSFLPREEVPVFLSRHDVLCQPSDEENFGSSVAEAQACGLPVIVGRTNGNADYLCSRDWQLPDDKSESLARILCQASSGLADQDESARRVSRNFAEGAFSCDKVVKRLEAVLLAAA